MFENLIHKIFKGQLFNSINISKKYVGKGRKEVRKEGRQEIGGGGGGVNVRGMID